ncbi:protein of unknown function [Paraburkholderia dioscoreae]|uniref:Uncharacterized protein n=1 Tax=Paraburkholderia dioscoreae TaxID=2604047 RepID=A0A5Q4YWP8_9BURK|nr:protein of unknown function [Paraburkholderia dioscoreae]
MRGPARVEYAAPGRSRENGGRDMPPAPHMNRRDKRHIGNTLQQT